MTNRPTVTLPALAAQTGRPEAWWKRHWLRMHLEHAFPRKLPGLWCWPCGAVEAWCRSSGEPPPAFTAAANQNSPPAAAEALLDQRFGTHHHLHQYTEH